MWSGLINSLGGEGSASVLFVLILVTGIALWRGGGWTRNVSNKLDNLEKAVEKIDGTVEKLDKVVEKLDKAVEKLDGRFEDFLMTTVRDGTSPVQLTKYGHEL